MTFHDSHRDDARSGSGSGSTQATPPARSDRAAKIAAAGPLPGDSGGRSKVIAGIAVALAILLGIGWSVWQGRQTDPGVIASNGSSSTIGASASGASGVPANGEGFVINTTPAKAGAPTVDVYEDFQCPICGAVHKILGGSIEELAKSGDAKVVVHMMSFLDASTGASFSVPMANAGACAADQGKFLAFHDAAFADQKKEGTSLSQADIDAYATKAGIPDLAAFTKCSTGKKYASYVASVEDASSRAGVTGTPTIRINGADFAWNKATNEADMVTNFKNAVKAATKN